ncbi:MAG: hypothetical protein V3T86_17060 [Planctomycetota bacterium]
MKSNLMISMLLVSSLVACDGGIFASDPVPLSALESSGSVSSGSANPATPDAVSPELPPAETFVDAVANAYLPLTPGTFWIYEGTSDGEPRRDEVRVMEDTREIDGVDCTAVLQQVFLGGHPAEVTTEWFAQDADGNVWKFGEESLEWNGTEFIATEDSWVAGVGGAQPWIVMGADPEVGDVYIGNDGGGEERLVIVAGAVQVEVPAGVFANCVQVHENPDDEEDADMIIYGPGVGLVSEESPEGRIELMAFGHE